MGSFFVNYQVRQAEAGDVVKKLQKLVKASAYVSSAKQGWVSVYDEFSDQQNEQELHRLAKGLSYDLATDVLAFLVHDSDVLIYLIYKQGKLQDEYNSRPAYWGKVNSATKNRFKGKPEALLPYCKPGTSSQKISEILNQKYTFEDDKLIELAVLLDIDQDRICLDFATIEQEILEEEKEDFELVTRPGLTPKFKKPQQLFEIAKIGNLEVLQDLLAEGIDPNLTDAFGVTALMYAAAAGHLSVVETLISAGATVGNKFQNPVNPDSIVNITPLMAAARGGHLEVIKALIKAGADVNTINSQGQTALSLAAQEGQTEVVELLVQSGVQAEQNFIDASLIQAVTQGDIRQVEDWLAARANVNATNRQGHATAVAIAASRGDLAVVEVLLQANAQVNPHLETTKINVSQNQPQNFLEGLLGALAQNVMSGLVAQSCATISPLWCAAEAGHLAVVERLLKAGAKVNCDQQSALIPAVSGGHLNIVRALLNAGANVNQDLGEGVTPLMRAASMGYLEIVQVLIEAGADVKKQDTQGWTALDYAERSNHVQVVRILQNIKP